LIRIVAPEWFSLS